MKKEFKGLIPNVQKPTALADPYWQYGTIENGVKKVDPLLHYGCFVLGYEYPEIVDYACETVKSVKPEVAESVIYEDNLKLNHISYKLADKLFETTRGYRSFYSLSGSDANEGAVKLASSYHYSNKNFHKKKIISFLKSYHGSTFLTINLGSDNLMSNPFYTMEKYHGVERIPRTFQLSDIDWNEVSMIVVETCSYHDHMEPNSKEFWEKLTYIQQTYDVIIILDDIFMGGGKTGNYVGWLHLPIKPDIFTMGKAITAGFFPLSMTLYNERVHKSLPASFRWDHGFTYNFSIPGVASAVKYLEILEETKLLENYDNLILKTMKVFDDANFEILNNFGLHFMVKKGSFKTLYIIPINATEEYFSVLADNLKKK